MVVDVVSLAESLVGRVAVLRRHPALRQFPELEVGLSEVQMEYAELLVMLREAGGVGEDAETRRWGDGEKRFRDGKCAAAGDDS
jgi:hypothetical protein